MKKWKLTKNKQKKKSSEKKEKDNIDEPKQVGIFHDFLIFDYKDKYKEENFDFQDCDFNDLSLKDWLILKKSPNKDKSRFSNLFQEILENDKKKGLVEGINEQEDTKDNKIDNEDNNSNNINDSNVNDNKSDNINIGNNINDNINNNINNNNINNNNNIINNKDIINNDNIINKNANININSRNSSEAFTNADTINNNIFQERISEVSLPYSNNSLIGQSSYETKKNIYDNYSGQFKLQNSFFSNYSGPNESKKSSNVSSMAQLGSTINEYEYKFTNSINSNSSISEINTIVESHPSKKKFDLNVDVKRIIILEDKRTTIMIKNIPNKFNRDLLLNIIDQNFKGAYDLFILPTDSKNYKNFGYSFINFTSFYYIPYFYFIFNGKKWSSTNSLKVCEITYSKIQGRNNLLSHYSSKITFRNDDAKKNKNNAKFIIPNEYRFIFDQAFPNQFVEEYNSYFKTKIPNKY